MMNLVTNFGFEVVTIFIFKGRGIDMADHMAKKKIIFFFTSLQGKLTQYFMKNWLKVFFRKLEFLSFK